MHIDADGVVVADDGDDVAVTVMLRQKDYGPLRTESGLPLVGVNHVYAIYMGEGETNPRKDGTVGCAERVAAGTARYYPHVYMARNGNLWQVVPLKRSAIHCEHSWTDPETGKVHETNRVSVGLEWSGLGWVRRNGCMPSKSGINLQRSDLKLVGHLYWQPPTEEQVRSAKLFWRAVREYSGMEPQHAVFGHGELAHGGHELCPGPLILERLRNDVLTWLRAEEEVPIPFIAPTYEDLGEPATETDLEAVFGLSNSGVLTDDELRTYFTPDEVERYVRCGALTHEDTEHQMTTLNWHLDRGRLEEYCSE